MTAGGELAGREDGAFGRHHSLPLVRLPDPGASEPVPRPADGPMPPVPGGGPPRERRPTSTEAAHGGRHYPQFGSRSGIRLATAGTKPPRSLAPPSRAHWSPPLPAWGLFPREPPPPSPLPGLPACLVGRPARRAGGPRGDGQRVERGTPARIGRAAGPRQRDPPPGGNSLRGRRERGVYRLDPEGGWPGEGRCRPHEAPQFRRSAPLGAPHRPARRPRRPCLGVTTCRFGRSRVRPAARIWAVRI